MELKKISGSASSCIVVSIKDSGNDATLFVFGLIESAVKKGASEILLTPMQHLEHVRVDFGASGCYYRQPEINREQFSYVAFHLIHIANPAGGDGREGRLFAASDGTLHYLHFWKVMLPDDETAVSIQIEPVTEPLEAVS